MVPVNPARNRRGILVLSALLFLFWMLLSSELDLQHILLGAAIALIVGSYSHDIFFPPGSTAPSLRALPPYLLYLGHLFWEIIKANIEVAKIVLDPKLPISPTVVKFKTELQGAVSKVSYANSISLTPGTLTLDIVGDTFYVHALTKEAGEDVKEWHMEKRLKEIEDAS